MEKVTGFCVESQDLVNTQKDMENAASKYKIRQVLGCCHVSAASLPLQELYL
jgi:hypothetical protein